MQKPKQSQYKKNLRIRQNTQPGSQMDTVIPVNGNIY